MVVDGSVELFLSAAREIANHAESNSLGLDLKLKTCTAEGLQSAVVTDLATMERSLKEANKSLESFIGSHDKEMKEYRRIASGIIAEKSRLAFEYIAEAQAALEEFEDKKKQASAIAEDLKKEDEKCKWLESILSIYTFCEKFQDNLEGSRDDAPSLRSLALELLSVKTYLDGLPRLQGKTPNIVKVVNPVLREIAKKLRNVLRAFIANSVVFGEDEMRICHGSMSADVCLALKKKDLASILLKSGSGVCFAIDALESLDAYEDETGGRVTKVGGGREQFELVLEGLANFFSSVFEGRSVLSIESELMKQTGVGGECSERRITRVIRINEDRDDKAKDIRSKFVESELAFLFALTFVSVLRCPGWQLMTSYVQVFDDGHLEAKQTFKQDWHKLAAQRMWGVFEGKFSSNLMFGFPIESRNFQVKSASREFLRHVRSDKKGGIRGLEDIDASAFERTISSVPELFIKKRQLAHVEKIRVNLKNHLCRSHDLVASMRTVGQPCKEELEMSKKKGASSKDPALIEDNMKELEAAEVGFPAYAQPALPVGLYRRVVGCILNHYYNALLRFVLSIQDISENKVSAMLRCERFVSWSWVIWVQIGASSLSRSAFKYGILFQCLRVLIRVAGRLFPRNPSFRCCWIF
eukprot:766963-Hanusia_phi.AAC.7